MREFYISRDKYGLQYKDRSFPGSKWCRFTDGVKSHKDIIDYLIRGGYNAPRLEYVTQDLKPSMIFEVKPMEKYIQAHINGSERRSIYEHEIINPPEIINFFLSQTTEEQLERSSRERGDLAKIKYLKETASPEVLESYKAWLQEKITPDTVSEFLKGFAQAQGKEAEIFFVE